MAVQLDLRDEETVKSAVDATVAKFGGIDVLVNNASAIFIAQAEDVPMKRFDLMNSINVRGTFMMSKYAIPHLKKASNGHIINLSPPPEFKPQWFSQNTAYTMSKYGMTLSAYGLAAELSGRVAVNALWPKTAVWTAAMNMLGGDSARDSSRKPDIVADAAYVIASRDKSFTGNFLIDEEVLREDGVSDFEQYAMKSGATLLPDFFLPERVLRDFDPKLFEAIVGKSKKADAGSGNIGAVFASASAVVDDEMKDQIDSTLHFCISDKSWTMIAKKDQPFAVHAREPEDKCDVMLTTDEETFLKMASGKTSPTSAYMSGKLKIKGKMAVALKVEKIFGKLKAKL